MLQLSVQETIIENVNIASIIMRCCMIIPSVMQTSMPSPGETAPVRAV